MVLWSQAVLMVKLQLSRKKKFVNIKPTSYHPFFKKGSCQLLAKVCARSTG